MTKKVDFYQWLQLNVVCFNVEAEIQIFNSHENNLGDHLDLTGRTTQLKYHNFHDYDEFQF